MSSSSSSIAKGCVVAGLHWRPDAMEGVKLGEVVAVGILTDLRATFHEDCRGFRSLGLMATRTTI
jgi:hypothetical protein